MYGARLCGPWPVEGCCDFTNLDIDASIQALALEAASETLWLATGQRFGNCTATFRPCKRNCEDLVNGMRMEPTIATASGSSSYPYPWLHDGTWLNIGCGGCVGDCGCNTASEVLFDDPVKVESVYIDGAQFDGWVLHNNRRLVRTDGAEWPLCQDWTVTGGPGTWIINAQVGEDVPALGKLAVGKLQCEIAKACAGLDCELPSYVTSVTRQGVTVTAAADFLNKDGLTGVFLADFFIKRFNPHGLMDRARAYSPDRQYV